MELSVAVAQVVELTVCELQSVVDTEALVEGLALTVGQVVEVRVRDSVPEGLTVPEAEKEGEGEEECEAVMLPDPLLLSV